MTAPQLIYCRLHPLWNICDLCHIPASSAHYRSRMGRAKEKQKIKLQLLLFLQYLLLLVLMYLVTQ